MNPTEPAPRALPPVRTVALGQAWSANSVNTAIYRAEGIVSRGHWQFTAFYPSDRIIRLVRRDLRDDSLTTFDLPGKYNTRDAHNIISLGIDPDGYLHVAYDHHGHPLHYRRSLQPLDITGWTDELPMTGQQENRFTYPVFLMLPADAADREGKGHLLCLYRHGRSGDGDAGIKYFDHETGRWSDRPLVLLKGTEQLPWTTNAYWNRPAVAADGTIHLTYTWRINDVYGPRSQWFNNNIAYLRSDDVCQTWRSHLGHVLPLPVTPTTSDVIWPMGPFTNLINTCTSALDSQGRLHVVFFANDAAGALQYQHLWHDGQRWRCDVLSQGKTVFNMGGHGYLQLPISRPEIVIDDQDRICVIYRGDLTGEKLVAQRLDGPDYASPGELFTLWDQSLGFAEPVIDHVRWDRDRVLSALILRNEQPQFDQTKEAATNPLQLVDWRLP